MCVLSFPRDCASNSGDLSYKRTLAHTINCGGPVFGLCHYNLIESAVGSNSAILLTKPLTHTHTHTIIIHFDEQYVRVGLMKWPPSGIIIKNVHIIICWRENPLACRHTNHAFCIYIVLHTLSQATTTTTTTMTTTRPNERAWSFRNDNFIAVWWSTSSAKGRCACPQCAFAIQTKHTHTGSYGNAYATYAMGVIIMQNVPNESKHVMVNTKKRCIFKTKSIAFLQYK